MESGAPEEAPPPELKIAEVLTSRGMDATSLHRVIFPALGINEPCSDHSRARSQQQLEEFVVVLAFLRKSSQFELCAFRRDGNLHSLSLLIASIWDRGNV